MNAQAMVGNDRDTLVFWLLRDMPYSRRMLISFGLIILGFVLQWYSGSIFAGVIPLLAGNALLLVRGYDNRVEFKGYDPGQQWQKVEYSRLSELQILDKKIRRWDRSLIDVTNTRGIVTLVALSLLVFLLYQMFSVKPQYQMLTIIPFDIALLFLPHWFTGTRQVLRKPGLLLKAQTLDKALRTIRPQEQGDEVEVLMLLKGGEQKMPDDIKIRIAPKSAPKDFLGLYGQVVINNVQGKAYPYFYMVLVARPGLHLKKLASRFQPPKGVVAESKTQEGVEILVIRQYTTKRSGYYTKPEKVLTLLRLGLAQMHELVGHSD